MEGLLVVLSGPSGVGKGTVCRALGKRNPSIQISISATTRKPRPGEVDGESYFFISHERFQKLIKEGKLLEWACVYGNYYGTLRESVEGKLQAGKNVILEIDTQGAMQIKYTFPEGVFIFLAPPNLEELKHRIVERGTESAEKIKERLQAALLEIKLVSKYDYIVVNDEIDHAARCVNAIISAEHFRVHRNKKLIERLNLKREV